MKTLEQYLAENRFPLAQQEGFPQRQPVIDHRLRADVNDGIVSFYIHPDSVDGDTLDFVVYGNDLRPKEPNAGWSQTLPHESGLWWWWNGDQECIPVVVDVMYSGTDGSYFAPAGQHGWTIFQPVKEMGGWWMRQHEPRPPQL